MSSKRRVAIVGATGAVGRVLLQVLLEQGPAFDALYLLASERSQGVTIHSHTVSDVAHFDFSLVDYVLFSAGAAVSAEYVPVAIRAGCVVIDNTSCFRYDDEVPLVIPEVNGRVLKGQALISNPNCSTIQMLVALKPIYEAVGIERIIVSTYQALSGAGQKAVDEFTCQINEVDAAFNVMPQIDCLQDNGYTREEMKMVWETRKILQDPKIRVSATCVRVPVINGHSEAITVQTKRPISAMQANLLLQNAPGVVMMSEEHPTPVGATGRDEVFVGRLREDLAFENGLSLWVVADNLRRGAATNAIGILNALISR
jgi:aspartate-semialdehyde dehydrogenase